MNVWIRRSLKVGLLAGGFVCIGAGIASAKGTSPVTNAAPSSDQTTAVTAAAQPQYRVQRDTLSDVIYSTLGLVTNNAEVAGPPSGQMQPMHTTPSRPDTVPASTTVAGQTTSRAAAKPAEKHVVVVRHIVPTTATARTPSATPTHIVSSSGSGSAAASQQAITAVGGLIQNPCGSADASLLFETSTAFGGCADGSSASGGSGAASQQAVTAIGGLMQNPCGSADASLLFETSTDFGGCATAPQVVPHGTPVDGAYDSGVASQQAVTAVGGLMQNPCGSADASLLFETSTAFGGCAGGSATAGGSGVASQQAVTAIGGLMQNPCGSADASLLFETSTDFGSCANQPVAAGSSGQQEGGVAAISGGTASRQAVTAVGGLQQNPCGSTAWSLLFVTQQDYHSCTPADAASGRIASQQVVWLIGGMQQNACGSAAWSLLFEVTQDFGTCGGSGSAPAPTGPTYPTLRTSPPTCAGGTQLVAGPPIVNGEPAGSTPGAPVTTGDPANIDVPVSNVGDAPVAGIDGSTPVGDITCASSNLAPGASTNCAMTEAAIKGTHAVPVTVSGADPSGRPLITTARVLYEGAGPIPLTIGTPTVKCAASA